MTSIVSRRSLGFALLALDSLLLSPVAAMAQSVPDSGQLLRDVDQLRRALGVDGRQAPVASGRQRDKDVSPANDIKVEIKEIRFEGLKTLAEREAQDLLTDLVGRPVGFAELADGAERLSRKLWRRGVIARVYFPEQAFENSILRIAIVEAELEDVRFTQMAAPATDLNNGSNVKKHLADDTSLSRSEKSGIARAEGMIRRTAPEKQRVDLSGLRRALLLANDLPGLNVGIAIVPGDGTGTSRLDVKTDAKSGASGFVSYANHGSRATGNDQLLGAVGFWPGDGSRYDVVALATERSRYGSIAGAWAVGGNGLRLSLEGNALDYEVGGNQLADLDARGNAYAVEGRAIWPALRTDHHNIYLTASLRFRKLADDALGSRLREREIATGNLEMAGDFIVGDYILGGGGSPALQYSVRATVGEVNLGLESDRAIDSAGDRTAGTFAKVVGRIAWLAPIGGRTTISASLVGQAASRNLDGSEEFFLGGPYAVRAFPLGEASGDEGILGTVELRHQIASSGATRIELNGFFDRGHIWRRAQPQYGVATGPQSYALSSVGFGVRAERAHWRLEAVFATPLGENPGSFVGGKNQDGSNRGARGWVRLSRFFGG